MSLPDGDIAQILSFPIFSILLTIINLITIRNDRFIGYNIIEFDCKDAYDLEKCSTKQIMRKTVRVTFSAYEQQSRLKGFIGMDE
ncbi:hypothetical protein ACFLRW_04475 [Acidobacteriota bacterium]